MVSTTLEMGPTTEQGAEQEAVVRPSRWSRILPFLSVLVGVVAIGAHALVFGHWIVDDASITFAYSRSFAQGLGPVLQPGAAPVEGYSNFTWMVLLALGRVVGLFDHGAIFGIADYVLFPKVLALICCAGILTAFYFAARKVSRRPWLVTMLAGVGLACIPSFVIWSFSGLENSLYALSVVVLAVMLFHALLDGRLLSNKIAIWSGVIVAFAALTRPDGLVYLTVFPVLALFQLRSSTVRESLRYVLVSIAAFAVPYGAYVIWRLFEFGRLLSNPAVAKKQGLPKPQDLAHVGDLVLYAGGLLVLVVAVAVGMILTRPSRLRDGILALLVPLVIGVLAFSVMATDWMSQFRFATPVWALSALVSVLVMEELFRRIRKPSKIFLALALVVALIPSGVAFAQSSDQFRKYPTIPMCYIADRLGRVFNHYADLIGAQKATLFLPDLGGSSMTSKLTLVDMAGLTDKRAADYHKDEDMAGLRDYLFNEVKPTFIHSRGPWSGGTGIPSDPRITRDYYPIYMYPQPGLPNGDYVRKDAVPNPQALQALRDYANTTMIGAEYKLDSWPLRQCGDTLVPGDTVVGRH
jgi:hypothetical protein